MPPSKNDDVWLVRTVTIRLLWIVFLAILALTVIADLFVDHHGYFGIDGTIGFYAWFGFASCVVMVVGAKALGSILKRRDDYYDR
jgi:hypothetical protein